MQCISFVLDGNAPTHLTPDCFLNKGQFKAGFAKKLNLKD